MKKNFKSLFLLIISLAFIFFISEVLVRLLSERTITFGDSYSHYKINGVDRTSNGMLIEDKILPFKYRPNVKADILEKDRNIRYTVTLDKYGYRNSNETANRDAFEKLLVGDSVAWGTGVDDSDILSEILNRYMTTYNLSSPSAGPASYMVMIDDFLKRKTANHITILYYENDIIDLINSWWEGLENCRAPDFSSRMLFYDRPVRATSGHWIFDMPVIRNSVIMYKTNLLIRSLRQDTGESSLLRKNPYNKYYINFSNSTPGALEYIKNRTNYRNLISSNLQRIRLFLMEMLSVNRCFDSAVRDETTGLFNTLSGDINHYSSDKDGLFHLIDRLRAVSDYYINKGCFPIGVQMNNLPTSLTHLANKTKYIYELSEGKYSATIDSYIVSLKTLIKNIAVVEKGRENDLVKMLEIYLFNVEKVRGHDFETDLVKYLKSLGKMSDIIKYELFEKSDFEKYETTCNKLDVFFKYLRGLVDDNKVEDVEIFFLPSERSLMILHALELRGNPGGNGKDFCNSSRNNGIACYDLSNKYLRHYTNAMNNALSYDGDHLLSEGNRKLAEWMMELSSVM